MNALQGISEFQRLLPVFKSSVPAPSRVQTPTGHVFWRYSEQTIEQAIVLKVVRLASALASMANLSEAGLVLEAGAMCRIVDETNNDILFLAGPQNDGPLEARHQEYLDEFFQEEFDDPDPIKASQTRKRVSRDKIIAYVSRVYAPKTDQNVSFTSDTFHTLEKAYSGYIHGAAVHIMDVYDGATFKPAVPRSAGPYIAIEKQVPGYVFRGISTSAFGAKAIGNIDLAQRLHKLASEIEGA